MYSLVQVLLNELKKSGCEDTDLLWRHPTPKKFQKENDAAFVDRGQKNNVWHCKYGTQLMKRITESVKNRLGETLSQEYTTDLVRKSILQLYNNFGYSDMKGFNFHYQEYTSEISTCNFL